MYWADSGGGEMLGNP
uniref:Uncharacterized protein n=1 Tax=Arundo donax TaxID=35708 RepID=A0A0A9H971_ARUDO